VANKWFDRTVTSESRMTSWFLLLRYQPLDTGVCLQAHSPMSV
jgi:hypothetical protein